jgi:hypothetical protein
MRRLILLLSLCAAACATYREDLNRGQRLYEENRWANALAIWRVLEPDVDSLSSNDQARYAYLRGMTDYRLKFRADARHWLALAKATEQEHPGGLSEEWKRRLEETLSDLNRDVYGGGEDFARSESSVTESSQMPEAEAPSGTEEPASEDDSAASIVCQRDTDCPVDYTCQDHACVRR